jgi:hypothetical protein
LLSKCANPACSAPFRYLHVGRIFTLQYGTEGGGAYAVWDHTAERRIERFWLCETCSQTMTVCQVNDRVVVHPLPARPRATSDPVIAA